jgi:hypothetical protein
MGFEERLLHEIGGIDFALQPAADLNLREKSQVVAVDFQQLAKGRVAAGACARDGLLG